jgi:hypothetical protein
MNADAFTNTAPLPGFDPAIHPLRKSVFAKRMDARVKPAHDGWHYVMRRTQRSAELLRSGALLSRIPWT